MYDKVSSVTMGYQVTTLCHHSLRNLLLYVTLVRCATVNSSENLPTSGDREPQDCVQEVERYSTLTGTGGP